MRINIKDLKEKTEGFTIIEVLIVLAIAGLILLIVFLAVPALQRNTRNTGRKEDAGRIGTAVNDFVANNGGALPVTVGVAPSDCSTVVVDAGTLNQYAFNPTTATNCVAATTVAAPTPAANTMTIWIPTTPTAGSFTVASPVLNAVVIAEQLTCNGSSGFLVGSTRNAAEFYTIETGTGNAWACLNIQ